MDWKSHYGPVEKLNFYKHGCFKQIHFSSVYIAFFSILTFVIFNKLSCEELHDEILVMGNLYTRFKDLVIFCSQQGKMLPGKLCPYTTPSHWVWVKVVTIMKYFSGVYVVLYGSHGWRSLVGYSPWGRKELDMTERLHFHFHMAKRALQM